MSLIMDFELAWKPFEDKLISYIANHTSRNEMTELEDFISFYNRSIRMWEDPSRVQCGFLSKWRASSPALETNFMDILHRFHFEKPKDSGNVSPVSFAVGTLAITIAGGVTGYLLPERGFLKSHLGNLPVVIIGAVVFAAVGGSIVKALYDKAVVKRCRDTADEYGKQIQALHGKLLALCRQFS